MEGIWPVKCQGDITHMFLNYRIETKMMQEKIKENKLLTF